MAHRRRYRQPVAGPVRQRRVLPASTRRHRRPAPGRTARAGGAQGRRGGSAMTCERTVLLVVHPGRDEATEVARRVEKVLGDNGIALRVLSAEAVDQGPIHLAPADMRALGVEIEVVDADERAAEGCELVLVLG